MGRRLASPAAAGCILVRWHRRAKHVARRHVLDGYRRRARPGAGASHRTLRLCAGKGLGQTSTTVRRDAIRDGNAWYQGFPRDIIDDGIYAKLQMPVPGIAGPGHAWRKATLERKAADLRAVKIPGSGHFIPEEAPEEANRLLLEFLKN